MSRADNRQRIHGSMTECVILTECVIFSFDCSGFRGASSVRQPRPSQGPQRFTLNQPGLGLD